MFTDSGFAKNLFEGMMNLIINSYIDAMKVEARQ